MAAADRYGTNATRSCFSARISYVEIHET